MAKDEFNPGTVIAASTLMANIAMVVSHRIHGGIKVMMQKAMVSKIIEELEQERAEVLQELIRLHEALKTEVDSDVGEGDPDLVERDRVISLIKELERKLETLDRALEQARQGEYGICERCHKPIDPARLEAVPDTTLCIECKKALERQRRYVR